MYKLLKKHDFIKKKSILFYLGIPGLRITAENRAGCEGADAARKKLLQNIIMKKYDEIYKILKPM